MKSAIIIFTVLGTLSLSFPSSTYLTKPSSCIITVDSLPDTLFYGLTAKQITTMSNEKIKEFCPKRGIPFTDFIIRRMEAKNYLLEEQIERDSIETVRTYERIDKLLGIDK